MTSIPDDRQDLFERPIVAHFSTLMPDGTPHTVPVWIDYDADADRVLVNTTRDHQNEENVREDPRVSVSLMDPDDPERMLSLRGEVDETTADGARDHAAALAEEYRDNDDYEPDTDSERVVLEIEPEDTSTLT